MRLRLFAAAVALFSLSLAAHADTIFNLTLTSTTGNTGNGMGSIDLNVAPLTGVNQQSTYSSTNKTGDILEGLTFTIGGDTFTLANAASGSGLVQFTSGSLSDITYQGSNNNGTVILNFSAAGLSYNFSDTGKMENGTGNITAALAPTAVTPEPSSFLLLGTGLLGIAGVMRKRFA